MSVSLLRPCFVSCLYKSYIHCVIGVSVILWLTELSANRFQRKLIENLCIGLVNGYMCFKTATNSLICMVFSSLARYVCESIIGIPITLI